MRFNIELIINYLISILLTCKPLNSERQKPMQLYKQETSFPMYVTVATNISLQKVVWLLLDYYHCLKWLAKQ